MRANTRSSSFDDYEIRPLAERCIMSFTGGAGPGDEQRHVQQHLPDRADAERGHDPHRDGARRPRDPRSAASMARPKSRRWGGDSVGWYEGDTLVVETINSHPQAARPTSRPHGKVTERYTRWSDDEIFYEFRVEDPALYTQSWGGEMSLRVSQEPLYEYACHEGNYALPGILAGARQLEREGRPHPVELPIFAGVDTSDGE